MSGGRNSSQDPDYVGPVGFEKKVHQTHFGVPEKKWNPGETKRWVKIGNGRYRLIRNEEHGE